MEVTKENFISARYIDNEKTIVEILYKMGDKNIPHLIEHDTEHPDWQQLMTITNLDDIHLTTHNFIKQSQKDFKKFNTPENIKKQAAMIKQLLINEQGNMSAKPFTQYITDLRYAGKGESVTNPGFLRKKNTNALFFTADKAHTSRDSGRLGSHNSETVYLSTHHPNST